MSNREEALGYCLRARFTFAMILLILPAMGFGGQSTAIPSRAVGRWSSAILLGPTPVQGEHCPAYGTVERVIILEGVPETKHLKGVWIKNTRYVWMKSDNLRCRWTSASTMFEAAFFAIQQYAIEGDTDGTGLINMHGQYVDCNGNGCLTLVNDDAKKPFDTVLSVNSSELIDTNNSNDASKQMRFIRMTASAEKVDDARQQMNVFVQTLDSGRVADAYDRSFMDAANTRETREQFVAAVNTMQDKDGLITQRQPVWSLYATYAPTISTAPGEYVLFFDNVKTAKGVGGVEFLLLLKEGGRWRIGWVNWGS